jgi:glycosyltransferase involved in cell wall biosynthesis
LIVAEHASSRFGGEAALPLHYFRVLCQRGVNVWLLTHARVRDELLSEMPGVAGRIVFIEDTWFHKLMWRVGSRLPDRVSYMTTGYLSRLSTQIQQRRVARRLVSQHELDVVHQPMPVSPKEPSLMYRVGAPVVIGPMNGGIDYPPGFTGQQSTFTSLAVGFGRSVSHVLNWLMPGKRRAAALLVANKRTAAALPRGVSARVIELVENGVTLDLWQPVQALPTVQHDPVTRFAFMGRLVDWKAVDLLLEAFSTARRRAPMTLSVLGGGVQEQALQQLAKTLDIHASHVGESGRVFFAGWLPQRSAAAAMAEQHVLVLPSLMECGGAVVLEAMAIGLPVIATAWGGPVDYLDAECGILVPPRSRDQFVAALADAMVELACDPARRQCMGRAGRAKVVREFDWEAKVDRMLQVYLAAVQPDRFDGILASRTSGAGTPS